MKSWLASSIHYLAMALTMASCAPSLRSPASATFGKIIPFLNSATQDDHLSFIVEPVNSPADTAFSPVTVAVMTSVGDIDTLSSATITLAIGANPGSGILSGTLSTTAVAGVATFRNLMINAPGTGYTLAATASKITGISSTNFNIAGGIPTQLVFATEPVSTTSGSSLGAITVKIEDSLGNIVSTSTAPVTIAIANNAGPGGTLSGSLTVNAVAGVATFPGLSIDLDGTGYTLSATSASLSSATSTAFNISSGVANKLVFTTQPVSATAGSSLGSIAVTVEDAAGNKVTSSSAPITLTIANNAGPGGVLSGTLSVNASSGVATFPGLSINVSGIGYTLSASSAGLTTVTSSAFNINAGAANKLAFTTQPTNAAAGASLGSVAVTVEDSLGNKVTSSSASVTLAIANNAGPGGTLSGTLTVSAASGVATFPGLSINLDAAGYTLSATSSSLTSATSGAFNISASGPSKLVFTTQPSNATSGASLGNISVAIEDANGNIVTSSSASVSLAIANNAGPGGTLSGTLTVSAVNGVATFPGLSIDIAGTGYTLTATSSSLSSATSSAFNITFGAASKLVFTSEPSNAASGASLGSIVVKVEDAAGNQVTSSSASVTLAIANNAGPGGTLSGTLQQIASSGVATFSDLNINLTGTGYTLSATASSLTSATSTAFNITAASASKLIFTSEPSSAQAGASLGSITVTVEDADGNTVTSSAAPVTLAIANNAGPGGTLSGTVTVSAISGVASFSGLSIDLTGTGYTLSASATSLTGATSSAFNITPGARSQLVIGTQPANAQANSSLGSITVKVEDAEGNVVTSASDAITLSISNNPGSGTLSGTTTVNAVSGIATIPGLSINKVGTGYTLLASDSSLTNVTNSFNITAGPATQLAFLTQPSSTTAGIVINNATGVQVQIEDAQGNLVTGSTAVVALTLSANTLNGTATVSANSGIATFSNLSINQIMNGYQLTATSSGLTQAVSTAFNITIGPPSQLAFTLEPVNAVAGQNIGGSSGFQVSVEDAGGNLITTNTDSISISMGSGPGTLHGTLTSSATAGVATFTGIWIDLMGSHTLNAADNAISGASSAFSISPAPPSVITLHEEWPYHVVMNGCDSSWDMGDGAMYITTQDIYTNVSPVTSNTVFNLSSTGSTSFYAGQSGNNSCSTSIGNSITLSSGQSTVYFSMIDSAMETFTVTASLSGWTSGSLTTSSLTTLSISGSSNIAEGACTQYTITNIDANGNPASMGNGMVITLGSGAPYGGTSPTNGFYGSDSSCTSGTTSLSVPNGQSQVNFYFSSVVAGSLRIDSTSSTGLPQDSPFYLNAQAGNQAVTAIEGPSLITPGVCSSAFKVSALDNNFNRTTVSSNTAVSLSTDGATHFFSDSACSNALPTNTLTIPASSGSQLFYVKTAAAENATLTSTIAGNLSNGSFKLISTTAPQSLIVSMGQNMVCYALNGNVSCWGRNESGQLGNGTTVDSNVPISTGLTGVTSIASVGEATCAVNSSGLWCWGSNYGAVFGSGSCGPYNYYSSYPTSPTQVFNTCNGVGASATQVTSSSQGFCFIQSGSVYCTTYWAGVSAENLPKPAVQIAMGGDSHDCAILNDGTVYCWGNNSSGQLGDGTTTSSSSPVQALGVSQAVSIAAINSSTCAVDSGGSLYCWGTGPGYGPGFSAIPSVELTGVASITGMLDEYGLIKQDGSLWYDGTNYDGAGYPGNGTFNYSYGANFTESNITSGAVSAAFYSGACAVVNGQGGLPSLQCWSDQRASTFSLTGDGSISVDPSPFWSFSLN